MADLEQLDILREGIGPWESWRSARPGVIPDLVDANLFKIDLSGDGSRGANLFRANLRKAQLLGANLHGVNLRDANLESAEFGYTLICNTNLRGARGLESCVHRGPSAIDFQTLAKSWPLPVNFLRGCGLSDALIEYLPSLLNQPIQFYSCFISYSTKDQEFADRLHADLQNKGVRCWFAPHDVKAGRKLHEQIDEAIRIYDRLLLILSQHSMNSEWVKTEIAHARRKETTENRQVLFPVRLVNFETIRDWKCFDADTGKDSAREVREYFIPDFSEWKSHDSYRKSFDRLVGDLKAPIETGVTPRIPGSGSGGV